MADEGDGALPSDGNGRAVFLAVAVAVAVVGLLLFIAYFVGGWEAWGIPVETLSSAAANAAFAAGAVYAAMRLRGILRVAWVLLVLSPLMEVLGVVFGIDEGSPPAWLDALSGLAGLSLLVAFVLIRPPSIRGRELVRFILDSLIAGGAIGFLVIAAFEVGQPGVLSEGVSFDSMEDIVMVVFASVVSAWVLLVLANIRGATPGWYGAFATGILFGLGALALGAFLELSGVPGQVPVQAFGAIAGTAFLALAGFWARAWPDDGLQVSPRFVQWAIYLPFCLAILGAIWDYIENDGLVPVLFGTAIFVIVAIVIRTLILLQENQILDSKLAASAAFKTQLLRFISHEMANPLSPLRITLQVQKNLGVMDPKAMAVMDRSISRLESMSKDVRTLALAESGRLVQATVPDDLGRHVRLAVRSSEALMERAGLRIQVDVPKDPLVAALDAERIGQVLDNLLSNAIKFTPAGGTVSVRAYETGREVVVSVADTGFGLTKEQGERLFKAFSRVHGEGPTGLGLGLYLCLTIIEGHGGRIWAESPGAGQGATFSFALPVAHGRGSPVGPHATLTDDSEE